MRQTVTYTEDVTPYTSRVRFHKGGPHRLLSSKEGTVVHARQSRTGVQIRAVDVSGWGVCTVSCEEFKLVRRATYAECRGYVGKHLVELSTRLQQSNPRPAVIRSIVYDLVDLAYYLEEDTEYLCRYVPSVSRLLMSESRYVRDIAKGLVVRESMQVLRGVGKRQAYLGEERGWRY